MDYINTSNSYSVTKYTYDIAGNVLSIADPDGHTPVQVTYNDTCNRYWKPLTVTNSLGQRTTLGYDYGTNCSNETGNLTFSIDPNGVQTAYAYNDQLDRVTQIRRVGGGNASQESQTNYLYPNSTWSVGYQDQKNTGRWTDSTAERVRRVRAPGGEPRDRGWSELYCDVHRLRRIGPHGGDVQSLADDKWPKRRARLCDDDEL